ncbi:hypothetical protein HUW51_00260 (plasmid) [Adhaeribacter swui]|uniref:TerB family tellurite resistance protein n=1 Tax=Adhaeribacter swui TaxID=2086471 RepID=A0A7G7G240_9BACT|nr:hypothetical protein [Adhaeribacter swui]QNF31224.1 hypothetical protein HUW51_00260 [Adhaeribacter swui]
MGLFEKLKNSVESSEVKRKKSHLKNLYSIALADGNFTNREFDFMLAVASKLYLDPSIVQHVVNFPDDIAFYIPNHDREKLDQIYDCVCMSAIDGEISERELSICKLISAKMGFRPIVVDYILEHIHESIIKGIASEIALEKLLKEL